MAMRRSTPKHEVIDLTVDTEDEEQNAQDQSMNAKVDDRNVKPKVEDQKVKQVQKHNDMSEYHEQAEAALALVQLMSESVEKRKPNKKPRLYRRVERFVEHYSKLREVNDKSRDNNKH